MSLGTQPNAGDMENVIPLFSGIEFTFPDPLNELLKEGSIPDFVLGHEPLRIETKTYLVNENQFPDQSIIVLDQQLTSLKDALNRLKFYLGDLDDLLPR